jgi:hypothetical protein
MTDLKDIPLDYNPLLQAERELLLMIAFRQSRYGQTGSSGDFSDIAAVALSASIASGIKDGAYRKTVMMASAEYIQRVAETPMVDVGTESKAA